MSGRKNLNERLDEEIRFHIEQQTQKNIAAGRIGAKLGRTMYL